MGYLCSSPGDQRIQYRYIRPVGELHTGRDTSVEAKFFKIRADPDSDSILFDVGQIVVRSSSKRQSVYVPVSRARVYPIAKWVAFVTREREREQRSCLSGLFPWSVPAHKPSLLLY